MRQCKCGKTITDSAYSKLCASCYNEIDDRFHAIKETLELNEWAKTAAKINKDAGAFMVNGGGVR